MQALCPGGNRDVNTNHAIDVTWSPLPSDTIRINIDASWKTNGIRGYIGVMV